MRFRLFFLIFILSISTIIAENPLSIDLAEGKNNLTIEEYFPSIYASQLIAESPQIQSITMYHYGQTFGYINTLGGIGTNFQVEQGRVYEIYTNSSTKIFLKY